jgi:hypothetical protein
VEKGVGWEQLCVESGEGCRVGAGYGEWRHWLVRA